MKTACGGGFVTCRFTHVYPDGPAPYFTFVAPGRPGEELAQWEAIKNAAGDALAASGATITHHHAVGRLHRPWYEKEVPPALRRRAPRRQAAARSRRHHEPRRPLRRVDRRGARPAQNPERQRGGHVGLHALAGAVVGVRASRRQRLHRQDHAGGATPSLTLGVLCVVTSRSPPLRGAPRPRRAARCGRRGRRGRPRCARRPAARRCAGVSSQRSASPARATPADATLSSAKAPPPATASSVDHLAGDPSLAASARRPRLGARPHLLQRARAAPRGRGSRRARPRSRCATVASSATSGRRPMRSARASGSRRSLSTSAARPTTAPPCGPPSALSVLKHTRSAPAAMLARTSGSPSQPRDAEVDEQAAAEVLDDDDAARARERDERLERRALDEADLAEVARVHAQDRRHAGLGVERVGVVRARASCSSCPPRPSARPSAPAPRGCGSRRRSRRAPRATRARRARPRAHASARSTAAALLFTTSAASAPASSASARSAKAPRPPRLPAREVELQRGVAAGRRGHRLDGVGGERARARGSCAGRPRWR